MNSRDVIFKMEELVRAYHSDEDLIAWEKESDSPTLICKVADDSIDQALLLREMGAYFDRNTQLCMSFGEKELKITELSRCGDCFSIVFEEVN